MFDIGWIRVFLWHPAIQPLPLHLSDKPMSDVLFKGELMSLLAFSPDPIAVGFGPSSLTYAYDEDFYADQNIFITGCLMNNIPISRGVIVE